MEKTTWLEEVKGAKVYPKLKEDAETEVVIIGGGLAGLLSAYLLNKEGKKVIVVEKEAYENSITSYTTAFLTYIIDTALTDLRKMFGDDKARRIWQAHKDAIDEIEKIAKNENIDCEFTRIPEYMYANSDSEYQDLEQEHKSAKELGFDLTLRKENIFTFKNVGSLLIPEQAKFHPLKFVKALKEILEKKGVLIFENTEATDIQGDSPVVVEIQKENEKGKITAQYSVMATYQPFKNPKELFAHKGMYISYVYEVEIPKGIIPEGLYQDQKNPYHYFRIDKAEGEHDRMILGGEDHRKEIKTRKMEEKSYKALEDYLKEILPGVEYKVIRKWNSQILEPMDGLAYIGKYNDKKPHRLVATAFSGNGMTYSMLSAMIFRDIIMERENKYLEVFDARRKTSIYNLFTKAMDYTAEFIEGALKNFFTK
jgi:glycine/D-amino acid oxidase-like deaminating enzyme